jgi:hypothetical protein
MNKIKNILIIGFTLFSISAFSQTDTLFNGRVSPLRIVAGSGPTFNFSGTFRSPYFNASDVSTDCYLIVKVGKECFELAINSLSVNGSGLTGTAYDSSGILTITNTTSPKVGALYRKLENGYIPYSTDLEEELFECIYNQNLVFLDTGISSFVDSATIASEIAGINSKLAFDSDKPILRVPTAGTNIGGNSITEWINWWYFTPPTISLTISPSTTVYEIGDTSTIVISSLTTNFGGSTLSSGVINKISPAPTIPLESFGSNLSASNSIFFEPQTSEGADYQKFQYSFRSTQDWVSTSESGTANSNIRTIYGVYPILAGMSSTDWGSDGLKGTAPYLELDKIIETEGNKTYTFNGSGFMYFLIPMTWTDFNLSSIIDHNGFNVTSSFDTYTVQINSDGNPNDWTGVNYRMYKLNLTTTAANYEYQFNR